MRLWHPNIIIYPCVRQPFCNKICFLLIVCVLLLCSHETSSFAIIDSLSRRHSAIQNKKLVSRESLHHPIQRFSTIICHLRDDKIEVISAAFEGGSAVAQEEEENKTNTKGSTAVVTTRSSGQKYIDIAESISQRLSLPLIQANTLDDIEAISDDDMVKHGDGTIHRERLHSYSHCLCVVPYQYRSLESFAIAILPLQQNSEKGARRSKKRKSKGKNIPFFIDFCAPVDSIKGRRLKGVGGEMLLKAVAPKKVGEGIVYDFTAGFGQDSAIMALGGASLVYMVERDPIISTLLEDAMRRVKMVAQLQDDENSDSDEVILRAKQLDAKLKFIPQKDGIDIARLLLAQQKTNPSSTKNVTNHIDSIVFPAADICYLDPMFPPRTKSAAVKKNMQILHGLLSTNEKESEMAQINRDDEEISLLTAALSIAKRVVVKRPIKARELAEGESVLASPSFQIKGSVNRWDVYLSS